MEKQSFTFEGSIFDIHSRRGNQIVAINDRGLFNFVEKNGVIEYRSVVEIFGSRTEPHITF